MHGYSVGSLEPRAFARLTSTPHREHGLALADHLLGMFEDGEFLDDDGERPAMWPEARGPLADLIVERLSRPDWYSDLTLDDANIWDHILYSLWEDAGKAIRIGYRPSKYGTIDWPCAQFAARNGAALLDEPTFGNRGFRYFGRPKCEDSPYPMYTLYLPAEGRELLAQLEAVEPHFRPLPDGEGSIREQFYDGLLSPVRDGATKGRVLWVQTFT